MQGERVSLINGKIPILLIAPHGYQGDDKNTALITEIVANKINCYALINRGWERSDYVDSIQDKADCNNINHCHEDVVKEEFLHPIFRFRSKILKNNSLLHIYYLHGMSNIHRQKSGIENLDIVVGVGDNEKKNFSCSLWKKDLFCSCLENNGFIIAEGTNKSKMAGGDAKNMNQLFVDWYPDAAIHSMQIEIIEQRRKGKNSSEDTAKRLADTFIESTEAKNFYLNYKFNVY